MSLLLWEWRRLAESTRPGSQGNVHSNSATRQADLRPKAREDPVVHLPRAFPCVYSSENTTNVEDARGTLIATTKAAEAKRSEHAVPSGKAGQGTARTVVIQTPAVGVM
ncbi:hypothetical protein GJ744_011500 [Endocarpon pusillum]|uniref:Uncharacterized protein n=1 Tax=Endocarpon pusillum TaxID=364733 RepID=A0A8H7AGH5_9EURO|nr:hypothetical protein GJ744_011500 [Endocarpon pusillum]